MLFDSNDAMAKTTMTAVAKAAAIAAAG